jgi:hypothetical protein
LSLTDLKRLDESLVHGLTAVFHTRVSYPGQERFEEGAAEEAVPAGDGRPKERDEG